MKHLRGHLNFQVGVVTIDELGWRCLRHSLATFFAANEVNLPAIRSILRHAKPSTTAIYLHRVNAAQLAAQGKFLEAINITTAAE